MAKRHFCPYSEVAAFEHVFCTQTVFSSTVLASLSFHIIRPLISQDHVFLGDSLLLEGEEENANTTQLIGITRNSPVFAKPIDFAPIWKETCWGSVSKKQAMILEPIPPSGFVSLGCVISNEFDADGIWIGKARDKLVCVHRDLCELVPESDIRVVRVDVPSNPIPMILETRPGGGLFAPRGGFWRLKRDFAQILEKKLRYSDPRTSDLFRTIPEEEADTVSVSDTAVVQQQKARGPPSLLTRHLPSFGDTWTHSAIIPAVDNIDPNMVVPPLGLDRVNIDIDFLDGFTVPGLEDYMEKHSGEKTVPVYLPIAPKGFCALGSFILDHPALSEIRVINDILVQKSEISTSIGKHLVVPAGSSYFLPREFMGDILPVLAAPLRVGFQLGSSGPTARWLAKVVRITADFERVEQQYIDTPTAVDSHVHFDGDSDDHVDSHDQSRGDNSTDGEGMMSSSFSRGDDHRSDDAAAENGGDPDTVLPLHDMCSEAEAEAEAEADVKLPFPPFSPPTSMHPEAPAFWNPELSPGESFLGSICSSGNKLPVATGIVVTHPGSACFATPLMWEVAAEYRDISLYRAVAPPGYRAIGMLAYPKKITSSGVVISQTPPLNALSCVHESLLEEYAPRPLAVALASQRYAPQLIAAATDSPLLSMLPVRREMPSAASASASTLASGSRASRSSTSHVYTLRAHVTRWISKKGSSGSSVKGSSVYALSEAGSAIMAGGPICPSVSTASAASGKSVGHISQATLEASHSKLSKLAMSLPTTDAASGSSSSGGKSRASAGAQKGGLHIWRPSMQPGEALMADYVSLGPERPASLPKLGCPDNPPFWARPCGFELVWGGVDPFESPTHIWKPVPPRGYVSLGDIVSSGEPNPDLVYLPREDMVELVEPVHITTRNGLRVWFIPVHASNGNGAAATAGASARDAKTGSSAAAATSASASKPKTSTSTSKPTAGCLLTSLFASPPPAYRLRPSAASLHSIPNMEGVAKLVATSIADLVVEKSSLLSDIGVECDHVDVYMSDPTPRLSRTHARTQLTRAMDWMLLPKTVPPKPEETPAPSPATATSALAKAAAIASDSPMAPSAMTRSSSLDTGTKPRSRGDSPSLRRGNTSRMSSKGAFGRGSRASRASRASRKGASSKPAPAAVSPVMELLKASTLVSLSRKKDRIPSSARSGRVMPTGASVSSKPSLAPKESALPLSAMRTVLTFVDQLLPGGIMSRVVHTRGAVIAKWMHGWLFLDDRMPMIGKKHALQPLLPPHLQLAEKCIAYLCGGWDTLYSLTPEHLMVVVFRFAGFSAWVPGKSPLHRGEVGVTFALELSAPVMSIHPSAGAGECVVTVL
eukprot:gnl/Dysnectes_brevis/4284_a5677_397.p1 GENE.gnl/Dysnectes_brevis/4284_a5677_397~~gnl/Dysnectes_brevis/4284_a5677_397.p1  ORF type:complete len:1338 (-),score=235.92 gnl/Dysnectes_brevis/4284_a5677_397:50-4063(-)